MAKAIIESAPETKPELTAEDMKAEIQKIIAEAKQEVIREAEKEAAEIIRKAKDKAAEITGHPEASVVMKPPENKVKIKLFKDSGKYKDDVFVAVNGKGYLIQRGVEVEVPESVAEVLANSDKQDSYTSALIDQYTKQYERDTANIEG